MFEALNYLIFRAQSTDAIHVIMIGDVEGLIHVQYNVHIILRGNLV